MNNIENLSTIEKAYTTLKANEDYWLLDNDYKSKYRYICECVELKPNYAPHTIGYIAASARFMLDTHKRIFG